MRDPKRIHDVIQLTNALWICYPDMRFFQLMEFIKDTLPDSEVGTNKVIAGYWAANELYSDGPYRDAFYTEDDVVVETLKRLIDEAMKGDRSG